MFWPRLEFVIVCFEVTLQVHRESTVHHNMQERATKLITQHRYITSEYLTECRSTTLKTRRVTQDKIEELKILNS